MTDRTRRELLLNAVGGVAWMVLRPEIAVAHGADTIHVTGAVRDEAGRPVPNVHVSNGFAIVPTDAIGRYAIDVHVDRYPFVFVNTPEGYKPKQAFYRQVRANALSEVEFLLARAPERTGSRLRIAHVTDSHVGVFEKPHFASTLDLAADYRAIIEADDPDLIVNTGDFTDNGRLPDMEAYLRDAVRPLDVPIVTVYGNHDADADRDLASGDGDKANNANYQAVMGPDQYSFDWGDYHIVVCGMYWIGRPFRLPRLTTWLAADLALQPAGRPIIVLTHDKPRLHEELTTVYGPSLGQLRKAGVFLVLFGHHHLTCAFSYEGLTSVCAPTVSVGAIDTSARGYGFITVEQSKADVEIRSLAAPRADVSRGSRRATTRALGLAEGWKRNVGTSLHRATPVVTNGRVLLSLGDRRPLDRIGVASLDLRSGEEKWRWRAEATVKNAVGVPGPDAPGLEGRCFAVEVNGQLACLDNETGTLRWRVRAPYFPDRYFYVSPVVTADAIYLTQHTGTYAFHPETGALLWQMGQHWDENRSAVYYAPIRVGEQLVHLVTTMLGYHGVAAIDRRDGRTLWSRRLDVLPPIYPQRLFQSHWPSPLSSGDRIVVPGLADRLAVLHAQTGDFVWHEPALQDQGPKYGPVPSFYYVTYEHAQGLMLRDEVIFATTSNGRVYALSLTTGQRLWRWVTDRAPLLDFQPYYRGVGNGMTTPAWHKGTLYLAGADGWLYALDASSGSLIGELDLESPITAPPVASDEGLVVACYDGTVRCFNWVS